MGHGKQEGDRKERGEVEICRVGHGKRGVERKERREVENKQK